MTAQARDRIIYNNEEYGLASVPLGPYLRTRGIEFVSRTTANWRGYVSTWEITEDKLFLVGLSAYLGNNKNVGIDYLFPGQNKVFADWFTGEVRIPRGELLLYVHAGFGSIYTEDLFLDFQNGVLKGSRLVDNKEMAIEKKKKNENDKILWNLLRNSYKDFD